MTTTSRCVGSQQTAMTTNVRDSHSGVLATDSRWTIDLRPHGKQMILRQDDADYQKIIKVERDLFMFAGLSKAIDAWKQAIALASYFPNAVQWEALPTTGMAFCVVRGESRESSEFGLRLNLDGASFAGTGMYFARDCWTTNKSAQRAVESAKQSDPLTGGLVRYYNYLTEDNNLGTDKTLGDMQGGFRTKGIVMYTDRKCELPIAEASAEDNTLHEVIRQVESGGLFASAPCGPENEAWPEQERQRLFAAMKEIFPRS
jgi:hypothetical protein